MEIGLSINIADGFPTSMKAPEGPFYVFSKSKIFKFLKRDCGTIPVAEIIIIYLLIFVLYVCVILCEFGTAISKRYACFCCLFKIIMSGLLC
jgi:hypothetical protein